jgi:hypothetical protein
VGLVVVIAAVVAVGLAVQLQRSDDSAGNHGDLNPPSGARGFDPESHTADAIAVLAQQDRALSRESSTAYMHGWDTGEAAQRQASQIFDNLRALRIDLHARYVAPDAGGLTSGQARRLGADAWAADVDVTWRMAGVDRTDARTTLTYTFVEDHGSAKVVKVAASEREREPVWLLGHLNVRRTDRTVVAATTPSGANRLHGALRRAVADVSRVLPDWRGDLVAYVPSTARQFDGVLGASPDSYKDIAAVTTTVDGSRRNDAPIAIVINPTVFGRLGPIGAHVVVTHEATHVATGATSVTMPLWIAEGFADYVGVGSVDVPFSVSAHAAIRSVRQDGVPRSLPTDAAFQTGRIEIAYEEAWLAMRMIAADYGRGRLVAFYEDVVHRPDAVATSIRDNLGTSQAALTRQWRAYLEEIVDGG